MKKQGREQPDYTQEPEEQDSRKWYERIDAGLEIPIVGRPRGKGVRVDFFVESQMPDMALEIKESSKRRFKNTNDVHRAAHYIGMYIIRQRMSGKSGNWLQKVHDKLQHLHISAYQKAEIKLEFMAHFEQFLLGRITEEQMEWAKSSILDLITDQHIKKWAEEEFDSTMANSSEEYRKVMNKFAAAKYRAKKKELGLKVMSGDE